MIAWSLQYPDAWWLTLFVFLPFLAIVVGIASTWSP